MLGKGTVLLCGTCMDARGLAEAEIVPGTRCSTMDGLAAATIVADKMLVF
ncbi:DsrE family protein [Reyranella sp.]|nr:DsrE family protein [Reyranella sp.]